MHSSPIENTPELSSWEVLRLYNNTSVPSVLFSPHLLCRPPYLPDLVVGELADRSSVAVVGYINSLSETILSDRYSSRTSTNKPNYTMPTGAISFKPPEERLGVILSNQYHRRMHCNRPTWYKGNPLDTAHKVFSSWRRDHVPLIRDWKACRQVVAKKASWMGKILADKYYNTHGAIWTWEDPASEFLVELFTGAMDTVEFAISADAFCAPHIVVTHSPGDELGYLDSHGNPDKLTLDPRQCNSSRELPAPEGFTPRQSRRGPTGLEQLFLPPRQHMLIERQEWLAQRTEAVLNRYRTIQRLSIQFHIALERLRGKHGLIKAIQGDGSGHDAVAQGMDRLDGGSQGEDDFVAMTEEEVICGGWSNADAAHSLSRRGIMLQASLSDLAEMADSAVLSDDEDEDTESIPWSDPSIDADTCAVSRKPGKISQADDREERGVQSCGDRENEGSSEKGECDDWATSSLPRSRTICPDTYAALRRLGMVFDGSSDEDEDGDEGEDTDEDTDEDEDMDEDSQGSNGFHFPGLQPSNGSLDLASILVEERSSVSSLSEDQDSITSGSETPDTEDNWEC